MRVPLFVLTLIYATGAMAQETPNLGALAPKLGLTEAQVKACLPDNLTPGQRLPQNERAAVFQCFKAANPDLTRTQARDAIASLRN